MGIIKEKISRNIQSQNSKRRVDSSKIEQAFAKYNLNVDQLEVQEELKKIITEKVPENNTVEVKKFLLGSLELTSLSTTDTEEHILSMVEKVNKFDSVYPNLPHVAGAFPSSQTFIEVKVAETALAIHDGAENVDIVMPVGKFISEDYEGISDDINELKQACGDVPMKVILETCDLGSLSNIKKAAILSMYSGADYIKTSTGKEKFGATPEAVYVMAKAIKEYYNETGIVIGLKPAGGINTVMQAITYYTIVKEVCGEAWLTNELFRLGTSRLANLLLSEIEGKEIKFF